MTLFVSNACSDCANDNSANLENSSQTVIDNIMTRTSVRSFTPEAVSNDTIEVLLKAGMAAPSAMNAQPWDFIVVTDRGMLDTLNVIHPYAHLEGAPLAIVVCGNMAKAIDGPAQEFWVQDCSAASENILLAAHALGLGAVWCGVYPSEERVAPVSQALDLPEYIVPLNIITIGHPAEQPQPKDKWKAENVHYQKW